MPKKDPLAKLKASLVDKRLRAPAGGADYSEVEARELELYAENDSDVYRWMTEAFEPNAARKICRGTYDPTKAEKLWQYLADRAAQKYNREVSGDSSGRGPHGSFGFPPSVRRELARRLARNFEHKALNFPGDLGGKARAILAKCKAVK